MDFFHFSASIVEWLILDYWLQVNSVHHSAVTLFAKCILYGIYCILSNKILFSLKRRNLTNIYLFILKTVNVMRNVECFNKIISNWAKYIKSKLEILNWVSKQFSDTSFPVGFTGRCWLCCPFPKREWLLGR